MTESTPLARCVGNQGAEGLTQSKDGIGPRKLSLELSASCPRSSPEEQGTKSIKKKWSKALIIRIYTHNKADNNLMSEPTLSAAAVRRIEQRYEQLKNELLE